MSLGFNPLPRERDFRSELEHERDAWRELAEAQAALLVAYRTGNGRRAGPAADRLAEAREELVRLGQDVSRV